MTTPQLHDPGEEHWPHKLHVGCGGVYLRGYVNLDAQGTLVASVPQDGQPIGRDVRDYYAAGGTWDALPNAARVIVDRLGNMAQLPPDLRGLDKILAVQCLEHLAFDVARACVAHWHSCLRPGGVLVVTVPDSAATLDWSIHDPTRHRFGARHIYGSHKDPWNVHLSIWTPCLLQSVLCHAGFDCAEFPSPHCYPAACMRGVKR